MVSVVPRLKPNLKSLSRVGEKTCDQRDHAIDRIGRKLLLFIEILPGAWGIREKVVGLVDVGPHKKIGRFGEAIIQAEHPRVFLAHLICLAPRIGKRSGYW